MPDTAARHNAVPRSRQFRLAGVTLAAALVTAACGAASETGPTEPDRGSATSGVSDPAAGDDPATTTGTGLPAGLDRDVATATEPWPTDFSNTTIDLRELALGIGRIDPRDAIPPIDNPVFESVTDAGLWLDDREPGVLVRIEGESRFYPLRILTRHEIVNDSFGDVPVAVTYCPLCNTGIAFDRRVDGTVLRFGVSGLLRNSDLVMWDDETTSLWQQITGEAIVGERAGQRLTPVSSAIVSFGEFAANSPDGTSLSAQTGYTINYGANPYVEYSSRSAPYPFFTGELDDRFPALERVVGVSTEEGDKAYPFSVIAPVGAVNDVIGSTPVAILWAGDTADALDSASIADGAAVGTGVAYDPTIDGQVLSFSPSDADTFVDDATGSTWTVTGLAIDGPLAGTQLATVVHRNEFWFAWIAFFPDAAVFEG
jgi:hypothetical protein